MARRPSSSISSQQSPPPSLESLPNELLQLVVSGLSTRDLRSAALVSKCVYRQASDLLWRNVCLADTWRLHVNEDTNNVFCERGQGESDEHDDTPIIQKLFILASNPDIASKVQVLTHRCHLPTPNIFAELSHMYFHGEHLSQDARLHDLLRLAICNMVNVHTLRIIYGHMHMTHALLEGFLDPQRRRCIPLRKLWLESCSMLGAKIDYLSAIQLSGLESIRIRRLRAESMQAPELDNMRFLEFRLSRGGQSLALQNGSGGWVWTTGEFSREQYPEHWPQITSEKLNAKAGHFDALIWEELPEIQQFIDANRIQPPILGAAPIMPISYILEKSSSSLTNLSLDWILWRQRKSSIHPAFSNTIQELASMRFPNLRSLQVRNAVVSQTALPDDVYLLESTFLGFLEDHPKLQCVAWPLDRFYSHMRPSQDVLSRSRKLVAHLGTVLTDLRLDAYYHRNGESVTDQSTDTEEGRQRIRRRRFIAEFAPVMRKIEQLKLEGGIPRDEKREILRALHCCPLKKIVLIGVCFPIGNTWGQNGDDLKDLDPGLPREVFYYLDEEDTTAIYQSYNHEQRPTPKDVEFVPDYCWRPSAPFLQVLAADHASTVEELKLCGYKGSPVLSLSTPITNPILYPLRHFHNLRQLVVSFWLLTWFETSHRDTEIIQSWLDTRSPSSTALVVVTPPASPSLQTPVAPTLMPDMPSAASTTRPQDFNRWAVALKTRFTPSALAYRVAQDIGPHLSPEAKARKGGVRVRASFCLGDRDERNPAHDIFDLDLRIGSENQVLEFVGPREEAEQGRWWSKLEGRRWF